MNQDLLSVPAATIARNWQQIRDRVSAACQDAGRDPDGVQVLPITKTVDAATVMHLADLGLTEFGENRWQVLEPKAAELGALACRPKWHFVGPLQRNKASKALSLCQVLHSVDSLRLLETVMRICAREGWERDVYLQVNLTGEPQKQGFLASELPKALERLASDVHVTALGLMVMGPTEDKDGSGARKVFAEAQALAQSLNTRRPSPWKHETCQLSMGMSGDLEWAVAAGSTCLRIGSDLFQGEISP